MTPRDAFRLCAVLFALCAGLALGLLLPTLQGTSAQPVQASPHVHIVPTATATERLYERGVPTPGLHSAPPGVPEVTSTPEYPDYAAQMQWKRDAACPYPILELNANLVLLSVCNPHVSFTMHLVNNNGQQRDFVTGTTHGSTTFDCQVGRDIPFDWLNTMPFTLTIRPSPPDSNLGNNTTTFNSPPPSPAACGTPVATPTGIPAWTPTRTCTAVTIGTPIVNLTGSVSWDGQACVTPVLKLRTNFTSYVCYHNAGPSQMRLSSSTGQYMDFQVSGFFNTTNAYDEISCQVGPCLPTSWLDALPFTLTVDVYNQVVEQLGGGEGDNISNLNTQPPTTCVATVTPTATVTMSPSPSPTPTVQALLTGHVLWQGRPPQPNVLQQLPVSLTLKSGAVEVDYPARTTDASGYFTVPVSGVQAGIYGWRAKSGKYLANSGSVTLAGAPVTNQEMDPMRAGDANNDNLVDVHDFNVMRLTYGKAIGDPGYDDRADFTGDQIVNLFDTNLLKTNFATTGAPPLRPREAAAGKR